MRRLPPLTELRAFEAAARHLSFKMAAAELHVTPTAISHQVKLLERHCGKTLFRRRPRPLKLTSAGEQLFPVVRDGFEAFADALVTVRAGVAGGRLRITATNAFAARWLVPRLPDWRAVHPRIKLEILGTDAVLDLTADEADVAIRYARSPPSEGKFFELMRDTFRVVASPKLVERRKMLRLADLANLPLIETDWSATDRFAPTWLTTLSFREESHAIEAAISGQGVAICSDVLIGPELASGSLVQVSATTLPGYGFYVLHRPGHPKLAMIDAFAAWARSIDVARASP
jgi:LysR family glycine cleavage system transcriptional activator